MNKIEKYISENDYKEAINECSRTNHNYLGILLSYIISDNNDISCPVKLNNDTIKEFETQKTLLYKEEKKDMTLINIDKCDNNIVGVTRVKLLGYWTTTEKLRELWSKMSKGDYMWNNIKIVVDNDPDYFVVINAPPAGVFLTANEKRKTIVFQMEPYMDTINKHRWGEWGDIDASQFFRVCSHKLDYNNNEWDLKKTYNELKEMKVVKDDKLELVMSTILSDKYNDPGHIKRIDFIKFLEKKDIDVDVFGSNKFNYKNYKGSLPWHEKDNGMFPYKYVFNVENNSIKNYYTEKLIDGILSECLVFYSGCFNVGDFIDDRAFIYLELNNFEEDYEKIKRAIEGKEW